MSTRSTRTHLPLVAISAILFVAGLALGAGRASDDTSAANTASKILLTIGLVAVLASGTAELLRRRRVRRSRAADVHRVEPVRDGAI
jgi:hypothetical protein